jgi:hypothetical protein
MKPDIVAYNERRKKYPRQYFCERNDLFGRAVDGKEVLALGKQRATGDRVPVREWDVPARCTGKVVFSQLKKDIHFEDLIKELQHREDIPAVPKINFTILKRQLIENEKDAPTEKSHCQ